MAPRIRDIPPPRKSPSIIGPLFRAVFAWPYRVALKGLHRAGFRAWHLSLLSLVTNGVIGWLLITGRRFVPGLLLIVAGLFDIFDGGVARLRGEAGPSGALLDSDLDRLSDLIIIGSRFWSVTVHYHPAAAEQALTSMMCPLPVDT